MNEASVQEAPSSLCYRAPCGRTAALPCTSCENSPSPSGGLVSSPMYCSTECANSDWERHEVDCLASRERRELFAAAKRMQDKYYCACDMDLDFAVTNGYRVGTNERYDSGILQRLMDAVRPHKQLSESYLACFGGYKPVMQELEEFTNPLRDLNVHVYRMKLKMKRTCLSFKTFPNRREMIEHKVYKVTTNNSESYALDIAGAQFGIHTAVVPWQRYIDLYVRELQSSEDIIFA